MNSARSLGYLSSGDCPSNWIVCPPCDGIREAAGDGPYTLGSISDAPWYDEQEEASHRFFGVHALTAEGVMDSTRAATIAEGITDGGVVGQVRHAVRQSRYRVLLSALGEDALESGLAWLKAALDPSFCGTHGNSCGAVDSCFFTACPPTRASVTKPQVEWNDPVTNLATNPSMETAGAAVTVRTNLATNPSFEQATAATVEIRRNLITNPSFEATPITGWVAVSGGILSRNAESGTPPAGFYAMAIGGATPGMGASYDVTGLVSGQTYTFSVYFRTAAGPTQTVTLKATNPATSGTPVTNQAGTTNWARASVTFMANATTSTLTIAGTNAQAYFVDGAMLENTAVLGTYFDGSTLPAGDFTHAWTGTANASASVQYAPLPPTVSNAMDRGIGYLSSAWAHSGTKSVCVTPRMNGMPNGSYAEVSVGGLTIGATYTVLGYVRLTAALTGALHGEALRFWVTGTPNPVVAYSKQATNSPGVYEVRGTFVANASGHAIRLMNGADEGGGDVWWDDFLVVEGNYTGPYFDGSTPAKVRRNLALDPSARSGFNWGQYFSAGGVTVTPSLITSATDGPPGASTYRRVVTSANPGVGGQYHDTGYSIFPGDQIKASIWVRANVSQSMWASIEYSGAQATNGTPVVVAANVWTELTVSGPVPAGYAGFGRLTAFSTGGWTGTIILDVGNVLIERNVAALGAFFDGAVPIAPYAAAWEGPVNQSASYLTDPDFTYAWTGTPNASTSQQKALPVAGWSNLVQSDHWALDRAHSARKLPGSVDSDGHIIGTPGMVLTLIATARIVTPGTTAPRIGFRHYSGTPADSYVAVPLTAGVHTVTLTVTIPAGTTSNAVRIWQSDTEVWWDNLVIVEGQYGGTYFDGSFPDSTEAEMKVIGSRVSDYEWTGVADASTSTYTEGLVVAVEDPDAWEQKTDAMLRTLHNVTCISGPLIEQKLHRDEMWGYIVEFTLAAGTPWLFGVTKPITIPPSIPVVVQDVPFNLVPYPSAELASGTVVAATNYSVNPSVETNTTAWSVDGTMGGSVLTRSTELAANGLSSAKVTYTAPSAGGPGWFSAEHTVDLPGITPTTRISINEWASASVQSGAAVLGTLDIVAVFFNGSTYLTEYLVGSGPASGGAKSIKSVAIPAGTTKVLLRAKINVTSWAAGAVIRLYADAAAVTVP